MKAKLVCTCDLRPKGHASYTDSSNGRTITFELALVKCPLCEAAPELLNVATAVWHLCESWLACPGAQGEDLIREIRDAAKSAMAKAEEHR